MSRETSNKKNNSPKSLLITVYFNIFQETSIALYFRSSFSYFLSNLAALTVFQWFYWTLKILFCPLFSYKTNSLQQPLRNSLWQTVSWWTIVQNYGKLFSLLLHKIICLINFLCFTNKNILKDSLNIYTIKAVHLDWWKDWPL